MGLSAEAQFHVLAVDDSPIDRKLIEKLLTISCYQVTTVDSGIKALQFLGLQEDEEKRGDNDHTVLPETLHQDMGVNLIITNYCMPGMTGYDLLRKIKQSKSTKDTPVVIMSSEDNPSRINRCLEEGAEEFILKPVKMGDVRKLRPIVMRGRDKENLDGSSSGHKFELANRPVEIWPAGQPKRMKFTPLLKNPRRSSLDYVNLAGIRVGRKIVDIPPSALAFNPVTGAGTIIDSGTVFTRLVAPAYTAVRDKFRQRVGKNQTVSSLGGFDTCYTGPIDEPTITFMFPGMNVTLPTENILIHSSSGSTTCLAMASAPDNVNSVLNVIASMQQQNHPILFDVPNSRLGVARELCT